MKYNQDSGTIKAGTRYNSNSISFNYQAGVTFKPVENGSIYLSYATSANPVGVDAGDLSKVSVYLVATQVMNKPEQSIT